MKRKVLNLAVGVSIGIMMTGCATLFGGGGNQGINIKSDREMVVDIYKVEPIKKNIDEANKKEPKEPKLIHTNVKIPSSVYVERSSDDLLIKAINEECKDHRVEKELNNWFWGDVLAGSLLSSTVDAITGAMWEYDDNVMVECKN